MSRENKEYVEKTPVVVGFRVLPTGTALLNVLWQGIFRRGRAFEGASLAWLFRFSENPEKISENPLTKEKKGCIIFQVS